MAKVILICGKICCGKTTYAQNLRKEREAVLLSVDELMLTMFGQHAGEKHDLYAARSRDYLMRKASDFIQDGINVIFDWGFWTKAGRQEMRDLCTERGLTYEFHYLSVDDETWRARVEKRNAAVLAGTANAYYIDENLAQKFRTRFEEPDRSEIDVWVEV